MKFLCDNCKAKYQIADEKVAGKTVRMKCRKCGHQIEVRAAVTETSVSTSSPTAGAGGTEAMRPMAKSPLATSLSTQKPRAPTPSSPAAFNTGALAGAFQRTVQESPQTVPLPPAGNNPVELSVTDEWYVAINGVPVGPVRITELRRKAASGAVTEDSLCWQEGLEEWRPVRSIPELAALVREAAQGNRPSLISPEPSQGRASSPPRPPVPGTGPQRPAAPMAPHHSPQAPQAPFAAQRPEQGRPSNPGFASPFASPSAPQPTQRSNVVPLRTAASASPLGIDEAGPNTAPLGGGSRGASAALAPAFSAPAPAFSPPAPAVDPFAPPPGADPFALPPAPPRESAPVVAAAAYTPSMVPPAPAASRAVPLWFWPILLFTGVFGAAAAFFVFRQPAAPAPVVIQMPTSTATTPSAGVSQAQNDVPPPPSAAAETSTAPTTATSSAKVASKGSATAASHDSRDTPPKTGIDLGGLVPSGGGPNVGGGASGPGPGGGGLDSSSVQRVVASHQSGVKRTCWERGGGDTKSSVNVTISAQVGPAGNVVGTSSTGDDPVVAKCIENQVKTWMFSAPGSTTTVNIPFKFVRQ